MKFLYLLAFSGLLLKSSQAQVVFTPRPADKSTGPQTMDIAIDLLKMARDYEADGKWGKAEQVLRALLRPDPEQAALQGELAQALMEQKKWGEADGALSIAKRLEPGNADWPGHRGVVLDRLGQRAPAEAEFRLASKIAPDDAQWHSNIGWMLVQRKALDEAEAEFREAQRCEPNNVQWVINLGQVIMGRNQAPGAETVFQQALKMSPQNIEAQQGLGRALLAQNKVDGAIEALLAAIALDDTNSLSLLVLGNAFLKAGKNIEAEKAFRTSLELDTQSPPAHFGLGQIFWLRGDTASLAAAGAEFKTASRLAPNEGLYRRWTQRIQHTIQSQPGHAALTRSLVTREATHMASLALDDGALAQTFSELGNALFDSKKWKESAVAFEKSALLAPEEARYFANWAGALLMLGRKKDATLQAQHAQKLGLKTHWTFPRLLTNPLTTDP